mgnify:FL=1
MILKWMTDMDKEGCGYTNSYGLSCAECSAKYQIPYEQCCLYECGENEFCRNCDKGIYMEE